MAIFSQQSQIFKTIFCTACINTIVLLIYIFKKELIIITGVNWWKNQLFKITILPKFTFYPSVYTFTMLACSGS